MKRKVRERQHKRNRKTNMKTKTRVSRMENISSCNCCGAPFCFWSCILESVSINKTGENKHKPVGFSNNIWPGLPWFQCWTNIILKNPEAIQNGFACFCLLRKKESMKRVRRICERKCVLLRVNRFSTRYCGLGNLKD